MKSWRSEAFASHPFRKSAYGWGTRSSQADLSISWQVLRREEGCRAWARTAEAWRCRGGRCRN